MAVHGSLQHALVNPQHQGGPSLFQRQAGYCQGLEGLRFKGWAIQLLSKFADSLEQLFLGHEPLLPQPA